MNEITLNIDGQEVKAKKRMTLLEAAESIGIEIPTLCHHKDLMPYGACRLCTVEIEKGQRSRLVASCVYPVENGLTVKTESERVIKGRKLILEFLWARVPDAEILCKYGEKYGIDKNKFDVAMTACILCGLCVRYCAEVKKKNAIGYNNRGAERSVMFFPEIASKECHDCGECFAICPTGVLPSNYAVDRVSHFDWPTIHF
jgi:bidirectional [NiFe] hydrogenase diaphorase subunit